MDGIKGLHQNIKNNIYIYIYIYIYISLLYNINVTIRYFVCNFYRDNSLTYYDK